MTDPDMGICANCNKHRASIRWRGEADSLTAARYGISSLPAWCRCCSTKAQIDHAEKLAARLPALRADLMEPCDD